MKLTTLLVFILLLISDQVLSQEPKTKNLVMICIDGYRWQEVFRGADSALVFNRKYRTQDSSAVIKKFWAASSSERRARLMPFFWNTVAAKGQLYGNRDLGNLVNVKNKYWFSYPGRSETLCGYYDSAVNSNDYPNNPNINVLEFLNSQAGFEKKVALFSSWDAVARIVNRDRNNLFLNNPYETISAPVTEAQKLANEIQNYLPEYFGHSERFDMTTYAVARTYMAAGHPRVVYIDFGDPDELAHAGQYDSYLDAAHYLDAMIGSLWNMIQQDPVYKDKTTLMVYPDHGRGLEGKWTSHGSAVPHASETWLAVIGPDTPAGGEMHAASQVWQDQFAQTAAQFLGKTFTAPHPVGNAIKTVMK